MMCVYVCDEGKNFKLILYLRMALAAHKEVYDSNRLNYSSVIVYSYEWY
jgi:hypothetical protein